MGVRDRQTGGLCIAQADRRWRSLVNSDEGVGEKLRHSRGACEVKSTGAGDRFYWEGWGTGNHAGRMDMVPFTAVGNRGHCPPWLVLLNVDDTVDADSACNLPGGQKCVSGRGRDETRVTLKYGRGFETEAK